MLPTLLQLLPAALWGIGTFVCPESPRWLLSVNGREEAGTLSRNCAICLSRTLPWPVNSTSWTRSCFMSMILWSATFLAPLHGHAVPTVVWSECDHALPPAIFGYLGIVGDDATVLATVIYGVVELVSTLLYLVVIVNSVGRRRSLLAGISLQILIWPLASPGAEGAQTAAMVGIYLHAVAWTISWFGIPYLMGPGNLPTRIRSLKISISLALH
ncbi:unnamed protein product [Penicillium palitans]